MGIKGIARILACATALMAAACAQQPVYTQPYMTAAPASFAAPLPVELSLSYATDDKPNPQRAQELQAALTDVLNAGGGFKPVAATQASGRLEITVTDAASPHKTGLAGITASVGHALVSEPEFTPQGRRSVRELKVEIRYTPAGGTLLQRDYESPLITVTNNTQEPTDLVPMQDRKHAEAALVGNDLNLFATELARSLPPPP